MEPGIRDLDKGEGLKGKKGHLWDGGCTKETDLLKLVHWIVVRAAEF